MLDHPRVREYSTDNGAAPYNYGTKHKEKTMPDIAFNCPECKSPLTVDESGAGMTVDCPQCGKKIQIPRRIAPLAASVPPQPKASPPPTVPPAAPRPSIPVFKNEPILVLILGFITCGLYLIYWNIKMAEVLNAVAGRTAISPVAAVLSGCCAPVNIYYYYLAGTTLTPLGVLVGKPDLKDKSTMLVILGVFFPMVAAMILQGHVNELYEKRA